MTGANNASLPISKSIHKTNPTMKTIPALLMAFSALLAGPALVAAESRPNVVMILTDDQRHDAAGFTGNTAIHTPNLDRLAKAGLIFKNCFVNTAICAVNRANFMAGQYPSRHGIDDFFKTFTADQLNQTVPARLRAAGYQTAFFGKWGIGDGPVPTAKGAAIFDYWAGQPMQTCFFHEADCKYVRSNGFDRPLDNLCDCPADSAGRAGFRNRIGKANLTDPLHVDSQVTPQQVARFLDGRDAGKPFALMVFFKAPHSPFGDWDPSLKQLTEGRQLPVPAAATLDNALKEPAIVRESLGAKEGMRFLTKPELQASHLRDYYRLVASMDLGVGRIMAELKQRGLADNTVILFTSDNGHCIGEHGLHGKWLMYEPSLRVPGFIMDPRKTGGKATAQQVITTDFSTTLLALAGLEIPSSMTGRDLTQLVNDPAAAWREDFFYDHPYSHKGAIPRTIGVRTATHSYTRYIDPTPPFEQLFDLQADPDQLRNLAADPAHAELLEKLRHRCDQLAAEVGPSPQSTTP
jgi:arylsulfatase A-like enzyme